MKWEMQQPCVKRLLTQQKPSLPVVDLLLEERLPVLFHASVMLDAKSTVCQASYGSRNLPLLRGVEEEHTNNHFLLLSSKSMINCIYRAKLAAVTMSLTHF